MVFGKDQVPIGRPKGKDKRPQKFKKIILDSLIKRKKEVKEVKYQELAKIGANFVPKEQEVRLQMEMPVINIIGLEAVPSIKQVIDTKVIDVIPTVNSTIDGDIDEPVEVPIPVPLQADIGGEGYKKESLPIQTPSNLELNKTDIESKSKENELKESHPTDSKTDLKDDKTDGLKT